MNVEKIAEILSDNKLLLKTVPETVNNFSRIENLSCDSRSVSEGTLFFVKGVGFRPEYLDAAVGKGAVAYVAEKDCGAEIPLLLVSDVRKAMSCAARAFYGDMTESYPLVGITGTKGKTSTLYMLEGILKEKYPRVGVISTNEARCGEKTWKKTGTTPEALELFSILDGFRRENAGAAVMEVSSQALKYDRVSGLTFSTGAFLNLAPDHISPTEHSSFEDYRDSKKKLFQLCGNAVVNKDDKYAREFIDAAIGTRLITFSISESADITAYDIHADRYGTTFSVRGRVSMEDVRINMPGMFNVSNALCAIACAYSLGIPEDLMKEGLGKASAAGRLEILEKNGITVLVDYAHNGSSFESVFDYADSFYPGARKIILFGCIGDRALDRRTELPEVAGKRADFIVMSTDDPGTEDPESIFKEVEKELMKYPAPYVFIKDRKEAVGCAIDLAKPGDLVILAGKGSETTQMVNGRPEPYIGDMQAAREKLQV